MMLSYRDADLKDLPVIVDIYNSTVAGRLVTADTEPVSVHQKMSWFVSHDDTRPIKMIEHNDVLIGWVSFQNFYGRPAYAGTSEISIYLDENQRKKGYGSQIIQDAVSWCEALSIHTLLAFIFAHNSTSIRLFEKNRFEQWGHLKNVAVMDGNYYSLIILGLPVKQNSAGSQEV